MRNSRAFEAIDDPSDPAWSGYEQVAGSARRTGVRILLAAAACIVIALGVVMGRGSGSLPDAAPAHADAITDQRAPLERSEATVRVPQVASAVAAGAAPDASTTAARGSGWAPAAVTRSAYSSSRLRGDTSGVAAVLTSRLDALARDLGRPIELVSGWRTRHEQSRLYQQYLAGTGNLAAVPGTSLHEVGRAADAYVDGVPLAKVPGVVALARAHGMHFPVPGEAWHVELIGDPQGSGR